MNDLSRTLEAARAERDRLNIVIEYLERQQPAKPRTRRPARNGTVAELAQSVLEEHGAPMRSRDLIAAIQARGGKAKNSETLNRTLSRHDQFEHPGRGLWGLKQQ